MWNSLPGFVTTLGKVLFVPSNRSLEKASNKVCMACDTKNSILKVFNEHMADRVLSLHLVFGTVTFIGAISMPILQGMFDEFQLS